MLQEMKSFFFRGEGTPNVWLMTAFWTGSIVLKLGKRLSGVAPLKWKASKCLKSSVGCRGLAGKGKEASRGLGALEAGPAGPAGVFPRLSCRSRLWWARPPQCTWAWAAEFSWMLQTSHSVYDGRFLSRLGLGGSGGRGGHSATPDTGGSFSPGGDGLRGRFILRGWPRGRMVKFAPSAPGSPVFH